MESQRLAERPKQMRPRRTRLPQSGSFCQSSNGSPHDRLKAETSDPTPTAPSETERMRTAMQNCAAKIGISTMNGQPIRLRSAKSKRMVRMGANPQRNPALAELGQHGGSAVRLLRGRNAHHQ